MCVCVCVCVCPQGCTGFLLVRFISLLLSLFFLLFFFFVFFFSAFSWRLIKAAGSHTEEPPKLQNIYKIYTYIYIFIYLYVHKQEQREVEGGGFEDRKKERKERRDKIK